MIVKILFPDVAALYGDSGNIMFLHQALPEAEIIHTSLADRPAFVDGLNMIYMGQMSENSQLRTRTDAPILCCNQGAHRSDRVLLLTGNAYEIG